MPNQSILGRLLTLAGIIIVGSILFSLLSGLLALVFRFSIPIIILIGVVYLFNQHKRNNQRY